VLVELRRHPRRGADLERRERLRDQQVETPFG
jgi:hypothetical protein